MIKVQITYWLSKGKRSSDSARAQGVFGASARANAMASAEDPQIPCNAIDPSLFPALDGYLSGCGLYYQGISEYDSATGGYGSAVLIQLDVSFAGTSVSSITSGNWIAGGISATIPTSTDSIDLANNYFLYLNSAGTIGVGINMLAACEYPPAYPMICAGTETYSQVNSYSASLPGADQNPSNTFLLEIYIKSNVVYYDWSDPSVSPDYYTIASFSLPSYADNHNFYYGQDKSCPYKLFMDECNEPTLYSYGFQIGVASSQSSLPSSGFMTSLSKSQYETALGGSFHIPKHAEAIGNSYYSGYAYGGYVIGTAYWHDNWAYGGGPQTSPPYADNLNVVEETPINHLSTSQANEQTFTATCSTRTVCVAVTNFASLQSDAETAGEGGQALGPWIAGHAHYDNQWWTVVSDSTCSTNNAEYIYANSLITDFTVMW
jgi:hypothetical protein